MYLSDHEARELIISIGAKMSASQFVTANDGNISVRAGEDEVWITPTGVNKSELTDEKLIKVRISDSKILEGTYKPTSELQLHLNVYRTDNDIVSTAHAHPLYLSVLACAGIDLDLPSTPSACCISGRVPVIPYECSGSSELANCIIPYVKKYHVVNMGNHGPFAWGKTPNEAWYRLEDAEASARLAIELYKLGRVRPLNADQVQELFRFHKIDITDEATVMKCSDIRNKEPGISFSSLFNENRG